MTTTLSAKDCIFVITGDKGISVGEWSQANIDNCLFLKNHIGLEVKDKSIVKGNALFFIDASFRALHLYLKNNRYDTGGTFTGKNIYLKGNLHIVSDKKSHCAITGKHEGFIPSLNDFRFYRSLVNEGSNSGFKPIVEEVIQSHEP